MHRFRPLPRERRPAPLPFDAPCRRRSASAHRAAQTTSEQELDNEKEVTKYEEYVQETRPAPLPFDAPSRRRGASAHRAALRRRIGTRSTRRWSSRTRSKYKNVHHLLLVSVLHDAIRSRGMRRGNHPREAAVRTRERRRSSTMLDLHMRALPDRCPAARSPASPMDLLPPALRIGAGRRPHLGEPRKGWRKRPLPRPTKR